MNMDTTYWIAQAVDGTHFAGETPPGYQLLLGNGVASVWSGTDHDAWVGECDRHGVDTGEAEPGSVYA